MALRGCKETWDAAQAIEDPDGSRMPERLLGVWFGPGFTGDPAQAWFAPGGGAGQRARLVPAGTARPGEHRPGVAGPRGASGAPAARARPRPAAARRAGGRGRRALPALGRDAGRLGGRGVRRRRGREAGHRRRGPPARPADAARGEDRLAARGRRQRRRPATRWCAGPAPTPPEYRAPFARVLNAFNDAPHDAGVEDESWDAERVRDATTPRFARWGCAGTPSPRGTTRAARSPRCPRSRSTRTTRNGGTRG